MSGWVSVRCTFVWVALEQVGTLDMPIPSAQLEWAFVIIGYKFAAGGQSSVSLLFIGNLQDCFSLRGRTTWHRGQR